MLLAFGAAVMLGVVAALLDGAADLLVLSGSLGLLAWVLPRPVGRLALAGVTGLVVGYSLTAIRDTGEEPEPSGPLENVVTGRVTSDPRLIPSGQAASFAWSAGGEGSVESLLIFPSVIDIGRGDRIEAEGEWSNSAGEIFFADRVRLLYRAGGLEGLRRSARAAASERILSRVPGSNGSLTLGLVIGDDSGLTATERDELRFSGLSHITAVSGSNVALVVGAVTILLRALNRTSWFWIAAQICAISVYVWIVGADPPIVRAAIMGSMALIALILGRPAHLFTLLAIAGAVMCLLEPMVLMSLGFQLSFLSMIGLGIAGSAAGRFPGKLRKVAGAVLSPSAAALLTAPLLAAQFGAVSLGTIPANIVVAPLIGPATILGAIIAIIPGDFVSGEAPGLAVWIMTGLILEIGRLVGGSSFAVLNFQPLSPSQTVAIYFGIALAMIPFVPEARLTAYRVRRWADENRTRSVVTGLAGAVMLAAVGVLLD